MSIVGRVHFMAVGVGDDLVAGYVGAVSFTGEYGFHVRAFVANQHDSEVEPQDAFVYRE